ncbi:GrpE 1, mitochondrial [Glycine soja]
MVRIELDTRVEPRRMKLDTLFHCVLFAHQILSQCLNAINFGDSGFMVVQAGCTIFLSPVQQHEVTRFGFEEPKSVLELQSMIKSYDRSQLLHEALDLLRDMHVMRVKPSEIGMISITHVLAKLADFKLGKAMFAYSVKGDKVFAKADGHSDNHKSNGKNHNSTNMPSNLTSARDHGMDKKKQEVVAAAGNGYDDFYDGLGCCHTHRSSAILSRSFTLFSVSRNSQPFSTTLSNNFHSLLHPSPNKLIPLQTNFLNSSLTSRFGFSSIASHEHASEEAKVSDQSEQAEAVDQTKESDVESECDLSRDDLIKLVVEKEQLLKLKHKEIEKMQRWRMSWIGQENFAKSLLDVDDNLGRASSVVKDSFSKIESLEESSEAAQLLKTLLEGVEMIEKQLAEVGIIMPIKPLKQVWDYQTKSYVQTLKGHTQYVYVVCFDPEPSIIITGSEDGTMRIWHSTTYRHENTLNYVLQRVWAQVGISSGAAAVNKVFYISRKRTIVEHMTNYIGRKRTVVEHVINKVIPTTAPMQKVVLSASVLS